MVVVDELEEEIDRFSGTHMTRSLPPVAAHGCTDRRRKLPPGDGRDEDQQAEKWRGDHGECQEHQRREPDDAGKPTTDAPAGMDRRVGGCTGVNLGLPRAMGG
ncbi:MAG: hypothetical protein LC798_18460 [Chloroflexi bacterium]|nr:hypothetical protein [Chloroflexota bacterium]